MEIIEKKISNEDFLMFCEALSKLDYIQFDELQKSAKLKQYWKIKTILFPAEK